jgi:hypothetical protein
LSTGADLSGTSISVPCPGRPASNE